MRLVAVSRPGRELFPGSANGWVIESGHDLLQDRSGDAEPGRVGRDPKGGHRQGQGETKNGVYYPKRGVTLAEASFTYTGDIEGTSMVLYLITYKPSEAAPVLAVERFSGSIDGREGTCVLTSTGTQSSRRETCRLTPRWLPGSAPATWLPFAARSTCTSRA